MLLTNLFQIRNKMRCIKHKGYILCLKAQHTLSKESAGRHSDNLIGLIVIGWHIVLHSLSARLIGWELSVVPNSRTIVL